MPDRYKLEHIQIPGAGFEFAPNIELTPEVIERGRLEYLRRKLDLIKGSIDFQGKGESYRGFRVGASVLADDPHLKDRYESYVTHNWKPIEHRQIGWDKLCAETSGLNIALHDKKEYIPALVTSCNRLDIGDENKSDKVLHPCENCRNIFREMIKQNKMSPETIVLCVNNAKPGQEDLPKDDPLRMTGYTSEELTDKEI
jgi:hypothetical protein